jgi:hypothetical protein
MDFARAIEYSKNLTHHHLHHHQKQFLIANFTSIGFAIQFLALFIWQDDDARNPISIKYKKQTKTLPPTYFFIEPTIS